MIPLKLFFKLDLVVLLSLCLLIYSTTGKLRLRQLHPWDRPGCHRLGHTRLVEIPGCVPFEVVTNACRGYCQSFTVPSSPKTLASNPHHVMTTRAECCSIDQTHDVHITARCITGFRTFSFKSAKSCSCSVCRKN